MATNGTAKSDSEAGSSEPKDVRDEATIAKLEAAELARLQANGIPVPGIEIKVDKHVARVWLEDLEVECANAVLRDRVRVVIERAVETVASMWSLNSSTTATNGDVVSKGLEVEAKA
jgi:cleavage and polyadenylation specificity factor subunit 3